MNSKKPSFKSSFASHEKAEHWHPTKNGNIKPRDIFKGTHKEYWFKCPTCKHDFKKVLFKVTSKDKRWCPYCSNHKLCEFNFPLKDCSICYNKSFASCEKAKYWHTTKNGNISPRNITKATHTEYWFKCPNKDCNHDFKMSPACINRKDYNRGCPYCSNHRLCEFNFPLKDCNICYNKSLASHEKAKYWHPTKNGNKTPRDITKGTNKKYWFKCPNKDCNHDFEMSPDSITRKDNTWCPYCPNQMMCEFNFPLKDCNICYNKSLASHEKAKYWHPTKNGNKTPRDITKGTNKKYWFKCPTCKHDFETRISSITRKKNTWCPYCSNKILCDDNNCNFCYNKSFASDEKAKYWHPTKNGKVNPRDIFKQTNDKYWFKCPNEDCNQDFEMSPNQKTWCPYCKLKTENKFYKYLQDNKEILNIKTIERKYRPDWANLKDTHQTFYEYDFYIELNNDKKIIIEIDGRQHYTQVSNWDSPLLNQIRDYIKEKLATNKEINIIRLNQEDVLQEVNDWNIKLEKAINDIKRNNNILIIDGADGERYNNLN